VSALRRRSLVVALVAYSRSFFLAFRFLFAISLGLSLLASVMNLSALSAISESVVAVLLELFELLFIPLNILKMKFLIWSLLLFSEFFPLSSSLTHCLLVIDSMMLLEQGNLLITVE
jgi:hypothetical protein